MFTYLFLSNELENLNEVIDHIIALDGSAHQLLQLNQVRVLVNEHQSDLLPIVHHVQLIHEYLQCVHCFVVVFFRNGFLFPLVLFFKLCCIHSIDEFADDGLVILKLYLAVNLIVLVFPTAVTQELVVDWSTTPICLLQKLEQGIEVRAFYQDLFPFFYVRNFLAQSTQLKFPIYVFELKIL